MVIVWVSMCNILRMENEIKFVIQRLGRYGFIVLR